MAATSAPPGAAATQGGADTAEEACLAHAAAAGDGAAFATLYARYERRIFNFCRRLAGSADDAADATQEAFLGVLQRLPALEGREVDFAAYLFTAARHATYDVISRRRRSAPSDEVPDPVAHEAADLDADPERAAMLGSLQHDVRDANGRLPERQREALALRELDGLSYAEIAAIMEMNRNSVAQLLWRARVRLRDELRSSALASIAAASTACERALPLIAMRQDRELADPEDRASLAEHLAGCETCRAAAEAMQEAGISYRAWLPILPAAWLWGVTATRAAQLVGGDWSEIARHHPGTAVHRGDGNGAAAPPTPPPVAPATDPPVDPLEDATPRTRLLGAGLLALVLLLGFSTTVAIGTDSAPRRVFEGAGSGTLSSPSPGAATTPGVAAAARATRHRRRAPSQATLASASTSSSDSVAAAGGDAGPTSGAPRRRTTTTPSGNSLGGQENDSTSTPTSSTPSPPPAPSSPAAPEGGTPSPPGGGGGTGSPGGTGGQGTGGGQEP